MTGCYSVPRRPDGGEGLLSIGALAPDLEAFGASTRLSSLRGQQVVVYFYPKDGTPGCTKEACAFRDVWPDVDPAVHVDEVLAEAAQLAGAMH